MAYHDVNHTFGSGEFSESYATYRARHWMRLMSKHGRLRDWLGFFFIGAPLIALRVIAREGLQGNWRSLLGLARGALRKT